MLIQVRENSLQSSSLAAYKVHLRAFAPLSFWTVSLGWSHGELLCREKAVAQKRKRFIQSLVLEPTLCVTWLG